jgi:dTDP-glucose 4,6-dehydratase
MMSDEHGPVNIGNPTEMNILTFAEVINRLVGNKAGIVMQPSSKLGNDPQRRRPDISRAQDILGWEPQVSLETGLELTISYFRRKINLA